MKSGKGGFSEVGYSFFKLCAVSMELRFQKLSSTEGERHKERTLFSGKQRKFILKEKVLMRKSCLVAGRGQVEPVSHRGSGTRRQIGENM